MTEFFQSLHYLSTADIRFLASPTFDLGALGLPLIVWAIVLYRGNRHRSDRFWKIVGLISDILSIVGIIGLAATVGRTILDENLRELRDKSNRAEQALQQELNRITFGLCLPLGADSRPTREVAEANMLCDEVRDLEGTGKTRRPLGISAPELDLDAARKRLEQFPTDGPDDQLAMAARQIAGMVRAFAESRNVVPRAEFERISIPELTSSRVLLICLISAWVGLCWKLARSIREVRVEQNNRQPLPRLPFLPLWLSRRRMQPEQ